MSPTLADLTVVVPSWNVRELLRACLASLAPARAAGAEVVVVDDASSDGSAQAVAREHADVRLLSNERNRGFAASVNRGAAAASERPWLMLLNADTEVRPGALEALLDFLAANPGHGAAAPRLANPDGTTQRACMRFPRLSTALWSGTPLERLSPRNAERERYFMTDFDHERDADVEQPPAAALLLARATWEDLGGLDERLSLFFNDVDLCRRLAERGRPVRYLTGATVVHHGGASTRQLGDFAARWHADRLAYYRKHHGRAAGLWVKGCTGLTWADHVARGLVRRARGQPAEPLAPVCRAFGAYLVS